MVTVGLTDLDERPVTLPMDWLMDRDVAPLVVQDKVLDPPLVMEEGEEVKEEMVGGLEGGGGVETVTVTGAETDPEELVAVKV